MKSLYRSANKPALATLKVALMGAPGSGKSQLATALGQALQALDWPAHVVIADIAAAQAPANQQTLRLLMGLQAPDPMEEQADQSIRAALMLSKAAFQVLYGSADEKLSQALSIVEGHLPQTRRRTQSGADSAHKPWVWACDKCSDPQCEHKLLTDLLQKRATQATGY
jgi:energy-coupling factor transporter ATP-binding protein EcfA2